MILETAKELKLFINRKKTKVQRLDKTFKFLQFKYYLNQNGHVVVRINPKTVTRMRRKLKKLHELVIDNKIPLAKVESLFCSWLGCYWKVMSRLQATNLIELYRRLFGDGLNEWLKNHGYI